MLIKYNSASEQSSSISVYKSAWNQYEMSGIYQSMRIMRSSMPLSLMHQIHHHYIEIENRNQMRNSRAKWKRNQIENQKLYVIEERRK
jgi:hypothetical protein